MVSALVLFVVFVMIYIAISDIFTIFFRLTGLTEEKARFQVISLLTNSGFTTRESESIVSSRVRRNLARATMLFGYAFNVTIVSTIVNFFMNLSNSEMHTLMFAIPLIIIMMMGFQYLRKSTVIKTLFDGVIEKIGNRIMFGKNSNPVVMVEDYGTMVVAHIYLKNIPPVLRDIPLSESVLKSKYNILVMMVKKKNGEAEIAAADTVFKKDDIIMVLGERKAIREVFEKIEEE